MASELDLQQEIIRSCRIDKGYGRKMSHKFSVGIPDLMLCLPNVVPCLVEVKYLGAVANEFRRTIGITPKQAHELKLFDEVNLHTGRHQAFILVGVIHHGERRLVCLPKDATHLSGSYEQEPTAFRKRTLVALPDGQKVGYYDIRMLMRHAQICGAL